MKTQVTFIAALILIASSLTAFSTNPLKKNKNIQVLPASAGTLKVLYFNPEEKTVMVRIYSDGGLLFKDKVTIDKDENGFVKRYDISRLSAPEFWVEIGDKNEAAKFRITQDEEGNVKAAYWDDFITIHEAVASK